MIDVFESFAARQRGGGALTVNRGTTAVPAYDSDGYAVAPTPVTPFLIIAQVSPTDGRGLKILADQGITGESRMLLTSTQLIPRDNTHEPDRLTGVDLGGDGVPWIVHNVMEYCAPDSDIFYRVLVARGELK